jgi:hypothetical protein
LTAGASVGMLAAGAENVVGVGERSSEVGSAVSIDDTIRILQVAVAPVILISGVGLLLLTMTNRLARVADRWRSLAAEIRVAQGPARSRALAQLRVFRRRAVHLHRAIELATFAVLLTAILVIVLFFAALTKSEVGVLIVAALFAASMVSLIGALAEFLRDVHDALVALELELGDLDLGEE